MADVPNLEAYHDSHGLAFDHGRLVEGLPMNVSHLSISYMFLLSQRTFKEKGSLVLVVSCFIARVFIKGRFFFQKSQSMLA